MLEPSHDVLSNVLSTLRVQDGHFLRFALGHNWAFEIPASDEAAFHLVLGGPCWLRMNGDREPLRLSPGDIFLVPHGLGHWMGAAPEARGVPLPQILAGYSPSRGVVCRYGEGPTVTELVCGVFRFEQGKQHPLRLVLPKVLRLNARQGGSALWLEGTLSLMAMESEAIRPGGSALYTRLIDLLLVQVLRAWLEELPAGEGGWLGALRDAQISAALSVVHQRPSAPWSVASLANAAGMSRSAFASKFSSLVGEPPMQYLTRWRLQVAASLLRRGQGSVSQIAAFVGYQSESSFGKAFTKMFGSPPSQLRAKLAIPRTSQRLKAIS